MWFPGARTSELLPIFGPKLQEEGVVIKTTKERTGWRVQLDLKAAGTSAEGHSPLQAQGPADQKPAGDGPLAVSLLGKTGGEQGKRGPGRANKGDAAQGHVCLRAGVKSISKHQFYPSG